jgi:hypothetical protein
MFGFERVKQFAGAHLVTEIVPVSDRSDPAMACLHAPGSPEPLQPEIASLILTELAIPPALQQLTRE